MTLVKRFSFIGWLICALLLSSMLAFKPLTPPQQVEQQDGVYIVASNRIADDDSQFRLTDKVIYRDLVERGFRAGLDVTNKQLTLGTDTTSSRCTKCHECGFESAWDMEHYGTEDWDPIYIGEEWQPVVNRMRRLEGALLNEVIADRVYSFLRDETLGVYDEASDPKGAIMLTRPNDESLSP